MTPKRIATAAAQGDIYLRRVPALPPRLELVPPTGARVVVAHSETGHHHALDAAGVELWRDPSDPLRAYLRIGPEHDAAGGAVLTHLRPWSTHAPLALGSGTWEVRRQREMTPDGWRRVED